jgi:hypothetical protein
MDQIDLALGGPLWSSQWTFGFGKMRENSWLAEELLAFKGLFSVELVMEGLMHEL